MRTFIAIKLPKEIRTALSLLQEKLKSSSADVKWVNPENIHLTLKFLGEIEEKNLEKIIRIIEEVTRQNQAYLIEISSLGAFPKINFPRIIWVGIEKGSRETSILSGALEDKLYTANIPKEDRPFSCHITLGRIKSSLHRNQLIQLLNELANYPAERNLSFLVNKITLFKSTLTPQGPNYEIIKEFSFKTT